MKKIFFVFAFIVIIFNDSFASDKFNFGFRAGINVPTIGLKTTYLKETKEQVFTSNLGFNFGILAEMPLLENITFQPGLLYYVKGGSESYKYNGLSDEYNLSMNYLHIPLNFLYKINLGIIKPYIMAGGYLSYAISGTIKETYNSKVTTKAIEFKEHGDMLPFDGGLSIGAGVEFNNLRLILNYDLGLVNYFTPPSTSQNFSGVQNNYVLALSLGYFLR